jgi:transposase
MSRYDLTDFEWRVIEPLLPNKPRGVPRVDDRRVLNGIFWVLRSGAPWRDLPERCFSWRPLGCRSKQTVGRIYHHALSRLPSHEGGSGSARAPQQRDDLAGRPIATQR